MEGLGEDFKTSALTWIVAACETDNAQSTPFWANRLQCARPAATQTLCGPVLASELQRCGRPKP